MDLHAEQDELKKRRHELASSKREHEIKLVAIKNLIRSSGLMRPEKYKQCCDAQKKHREAIEHIEGLLGPINVRIHDIAEIQFQERSPDKKRIKELERENAALRADKERLDKLEKMLVDVKILPIGDNELVEERYLRLGIVRGKTMRQFLDSVSGE